jgi:hypothetical protein
MENFRKFILSQVKVPVERVSFRKDKWGELATVYFAKAAKSVSIGNDFDHDQLESFIHWVNNGSILFIRHAKECYGNKWGNYIKHRK